MGAATLDRILADYAAVSGNKPEVYQRFQVQLNNTYAEVEANGFYQVQAKARLTSAVALEMGKTEVTVFTPVDPADIPPPPHSAPLAAPDISVAGDAVGIQPLPFSTYVNSEPVTINNALLYQEYTYVKLRELANVTNMDTNMFSNKPIMPMPGICLRARAFLSRRLCTPKIRVRL